MIRKEVFDVMCERCGAKIFNGDACCYENCDELKLYDEKSEGEALSPTELADRLISIYKESYLEDDDQEEVHYRMDATIIDFLISLGYDEAAYIFDKTPKWYA